MENRGSETIFKLITKNSNMKQTYLCFFILNSMKNRVNRISAITGYIQKYPRTVPSA
jgi:sugar diacid utilization regulator